MKVISTSKMARKGQITINSKEIETPCFFPSISSYGLKIPLETVTSIVKEYTPPRILVSCYDIEKYSKAFDFLDDYNGIKFYDSGLFESYWLNDKSWTFSKYLDVIRSNQPDIYTSFDYIPEEKTDSKKYIENTSKLIDDSNIKENAFFLPVIHPNNQVNILNLTTKLLEKHGENIKGFSFSEKDMGYNIIDIIKNIKTIKKMVEKVQEDTIIHMLGCGHPINLLIYASLGVDIFDSRSWSNSVINGYNLMQYPFSYLEGIDCECDICKKADIDYVTKTLLHNVISYENITNSIKEWIDKDELQDMLSTYIYNDKILQEIKKE
ncbi:MAG: hypothetical protein ACTSW1_16045 [Candidatus Hodarchaeales archaeon]